MKKIITAVMLSLIVFSCTKDIAVEGSKSIETSNHGWPWFMTTPMDSLFEIWNVPMFKVFDVTPLNTTPRNQAFVGNGGRKKVYLIPLPPPKVGSEYSPAQVRTYFDSIGYSVAPAGYLFGLAKEHYLVLKYQPRNLACVHVGLKTTPRNGDSTIGVIYLLNQSAIGTPLLINGGYSNAPTPFFYEVACFKKD